MMIYDENYNYDDDDSSTIVCQLMIRYIDDTFDEFESSIFN